MRDQASPNPPLTSGISYTCRCLPLILPSQAVRAGSSFAGPWTDSPASASGRTRPERPRVAAPAATLPRNPRRWVGSLKSSMGTSGMCDVDLWKSLGPGPLRNEPGGGGGVDCPRPAPGERQGQGERHRPTATLADKLLAGHPAAP